MKRNLITVAGLSLVCALLAGCERPPVETVQRGYRGTGMELVYNPRTLAEQAPSHQAPAPLDAASPDGPKAGQVYQNVKVLGNLSVGEFNRTMAAMTSWVAPKQGCVHCHNVQNFADDSLYTKVVARRMLQMTQTVNSQWQSHVGKTGVTCYTCHRGEPVPKEVWFQPLQPKGANGFAGDRAGQNAPATSVGLTSLPNDPFTPFLLGAEPIRVAGTEALPAGNRQSIKQAEWTYGLMVHMSNALGVNCTQCHNTRALGSWANSSPPRVTAWHGIRMARELNLEYLVPLTSSFPAYRLGPAGDVAKVNCATCHQGAHKPLYGAEMAKYHPELLVKPAAPAAAASGVAALTADDVKTLQAMPAALTKPTGAPG
ncbi:MAG: photosynthetic reaction center cytochrome PufC [Roseateles sp.]|jgi:photosynthetic reaction center cytochrome c subunit|nr:photosynthetic reaction center cytochrome c subunit [Methylibium sp.]MBY0366975.1 photosynthetic reaction center cytochrome c subunit [Burkholderiaceae bacterium]|mmetsp:Transcript_53735/g.126558  ORF Transcript_53735/g.126558 Transcript_53735/m.126558 type:complete len:371 (+) Transcript_53735:5057-6169(+)